MKLYRCIISLGLAILISGCDMPEWAKWGGQPATPASPKSPGVSAQADKLEDVSSSALEVEERYFQEYHSLAWKDSVNLSTKEEYFPAVAKINPRTLRSTIDEYYVPMVSEELHRMVNYYELLDTFDDAFLGKYDIDLRAIP